MGGDFSYDDASNDFVWNASDSLVVLGSADITANSFSNSGDITADTLSLSVAGDFDYGSDFQNNGNIDATNQNFIVRNGDFTNNTSIALAGNLGITANNFINTGGTIAVDTLSLSVVGDFDYADNYLNNGNIDATSLNLQVGGYFFYDDASNDFVWNASDSLVVFGSADITANSFSNSGDITADTLSLSVAGDFDYGSDFQNNGNIDATNQNFIVRNGDFTNNTNIALVGNLGITANYFINTNGTIAVDTFTLSVVGDFDYTGNIDATSLNIQVGGDFFYDDASNDFVWNASDSFIVLGSADITANSFSNSGNITANTLNLSVAGDFDYGSDFLGNGNIDATTLNFQVGGDFSYSNANNNFVWNANNSLVVLGSASVIADDFSNKGRIDVAGNFNVAARDDFFNRGRIDVVGNFDVVAGDDFYNWYGATINANNFNVLTGDRFYNLQCNNQCR